LPAGVHFGTSAVFRSLSKSRDSVEDGTKSRAVVGYGGGLRHNHEARRLVAFSLD
jgi:hypothetical protein